MTVSKHYQMQHHRARRRFDAQSDVGMGAKICQFVPFVLAGAVIVGGVVAAGSYFGQNAVARSLPADAWHDVSLVSNKSNLQTSQVGPNHLPITQANLYQDSQNKDFYTSATTISLKSSLLKEEPIGAGTVLMKSTVVSEADKTDRLSDAAELVKKPTALARIEKAIVSPPVWKIEKSWKLGRARKSKAITKRNARLAEQSCLSRAIYFEARSESELGQLAVARVILNRVRSKAYPNTICGVVYQGADRRNSCQFSFACDGQTDHPKSGKPWSQARRVATKALHGGTAKVQIISTATHYHADYVKPKWANAMHRLIKIGDHIFYNDS